MTPRSAALLTAALTLALPTFAQAASAAGAASAAPQEPAARRGFYQPPADLSGPAGRVLKQHPTTISLTADGTTPVPADAVRLMYTSRDAHAQPTAVTGTLITPQAPWAGPGERPLITFAVGTQGMGDRCAPSKQLKQGSEYEAGFISSYLQRGYAVVVSDYEGLGTPGTHAYVNTVALGNNVLDAARAATRLDGDQAVPHSAPIYISGYSEGGNAAGGALERRARYAPGLNVQGGYAGAVPANLRKVGPPLDGSPYVAFLLYSVASLRADYPGLHVNRFLNAKGRRAVEQANHTCTDDGVTMFAGQRSEDYTRNGKPIDTYLGRPRVRRVLHSLRIGLTAPDVPAFVAHSRNDDVVPFGQDAAAVRSWCRLGATVEFAPGEAPSHVAGAAEAFPKAAQWIEARVEGQPAPSTCDG